MAVSIYPRTMVMLCAFFTAAMLGAPSLAAAPTDARLGLSPDGKVHLQAKDTTFFSLSPFAADLGWKMYSPEATTTASKDAASFNLKVGKTDIAGEARVIEKDGQAEATWVLVPNADVTLNCLAMNTDIPVGILSGGTWQADEKKGTFPPVLGMPGLMGSGNVRSLAINFPDGKSISMTFPQPTLVSMQDNRQYGGVSYSIRIGSRGINFRVAAQERYIISMAIRVPGGLSCFRDHPVTLAADQDWVPLKSELDIQPGSALDLSGQGFTDGPCGSRGRIIATPEGHFAYASDPKTPKRFYGVNLCFSAQYLTREQADILLDRLVRLGYNTVRIHHYESGLTKPEWKIGFDWDADKVDRLDYLIAGCAKRGLWLTTDLYVSRPVPGKQIGLQGDRPEPDRFKRLVPVYEPAFKDWETFARKLLDHVNPYTGKRLAEEPALAWISLINEGGGFDPKVPQWQAAWNRWLAAKYPTRDELDIALGDLIEAEDPATQSVLFPQSIRSGSRRARIFQVFLADTERAMVQRMKTFLRDELKCPALITDLNCPPNYVPMQRTRYDSFDYVDDHFYVDHPMFPVNQWHLPSTCNNANPVREGAPGGGSSASLRIWGKPFTITEFDYSGPGRFRGVGGILTGALASLQDWDALWRFAYAHRDTDVSTPAPMDYFNIVRDPLNQAADRAVIMLFLRGDLRPAPNRIAVEMPVKDLINPPGRVSLADSTWLAWTTRIGCAVLSENAMPPTGSIAIPMRRLGDRAAVAALLKEKQITAPASQDSVIRSETGEIILDKENGVLCIDTPRTAGGYAEPGQTVLARGAGVQAADFSIGATVFVTSLDKKPIRQSSRLLVTHLTDLQNTGTKYSETARQTLQEWGTLPHLVRDGSAKIRIALADPTAYSVWAISTSGRRLGKMDAKVEGKELVFTASVRSADGARMLYEIAR